MARRQIPAGGPSALKTERKCFFEKAAQHRSEIADVFRGLTASHRRARGSPVATAQQWQTADKGWSSRVGGLGGASDAHRKQRHTQPRKEDGNEHSYFIKGGEFLDQLSDY